MKKAKSKSKTYIEILKEDHKKVKALFAKFEKTKSNTSKETIVKTVLQELLVHAQVEEEIVYPELRKVIAVDLMDEADVEHAVAKGLISELREMKTGDDHYDAKVTVLGELIHHHVQEEEGELFPKAVKKVKNADLITFQVAERKKTLAAEIKI